MKKLVLILLILTFLVPIACGRLPQIDPEVINEVQDFHQVSIDQGVPTPVNDIDIEFQEGSREDRENTIADCIRMLGYKRIVIYRHVWSQMGPAAKRATIFHELGHCQLGRKHNNEMGIDYIGHPYPKSIMNSEIVDDATYKIHKEEHEFELFNPGGKK